MSSDVVTRRRLISGPAIACAIALAGWMAPGRHAASQPQGQQGQRAGGAPQVPGGAAQVDDNRIDKAQLDAWMTQYSNWGRWGKDDERGARNLITAAKRQRATKLGKAGITVSLERTFATERSVD